MKPLKLKMSAFGTFAKETVIDFEKIGRQGVFLISGSNGSGKTSIFDAISFALYGKTSNPEKRASKNIHSDFASEKEKVHVCLRFSHQGKIFEVDRQGKLNVTDGQKKLNMSPVTLCEIRNGEKFLLAERQTNVDNKIADMLGMNQKQFSQTVMIAQGEFQKIVNAESKERLKLFQDLFHTGIYQQFQERLKEKNTEFSRKMEFLQQNAEQDFQRMELSSEWYPKTEPSPDKKFQVFLDALAKQNQKETELLHTLSEQKQHHQQELNSLIRQMTEGELLNAQFSELEQKEQAVKQILSRKEEMNQKKLQIQNARNAEKVSSHEQMLLQLRNQLAGKNQQTDVCLRNSAEASAKLATLQEILLQAESEAEQLDSLREQEKKLLSAQPLFQELRRKEKDFQKQQDFFRKSETEYHEAEQNYHTLLTAFLSGQAGIIAEQELIENQPCPVCGSVHHPKPAVRMQNTPSQTQVQNAEKIRNQKEQAFRKYSQNCAGLRAELDSLRQNPVLQSVQEDSMLQNLSECRGKIQNLESNLNHARQTFQKQENLCAGLSANLEQLRKDAELLTLKVQEQETAFRNALTQNGFPDADTYHGAVLESRIISQLENEVQSGRAEYVSLRDAVQELKAKTAGKQPVLLDDLHQARIRKEQVFQQTENQLRELDKHQHQNIQTEKSLRECLHQMEQIREEWMLYSDLYKTVSGQKGSGQAKLQLETYVQQYYFRRVIVRANQRLSMLTGDKFVLRCSETAMNLRSQSGLGLEVLDNSTGQWREVSTLSGGESFLTSLSLALGLSDTVQETSGGMELDAMFIDEGFGTLDEQSLHQAVSLLGKLADGHRLIGVISHVEMLKNRIDSQIQVVKESDGSRIVSE